MEQVDFDALEEEIGLNSDVDTIGELISTVLPLVWMIAGIALLAYFIFAGFQLMTSAGNPKIKAMAQGRITNALLGFVIMFTAFWIVELVGIIFGIDSITIIFTN